MKSTLRLPVSYSLYNEELIRLDNKIDHDVAYAIKDEKLYAIYYAWDYIANIWFDDALEYWCAEILKFHTYECSHMASTLEELLQEMSEMHHEKI